MAYIYSALLEDPTHSIITFAWDLVFSSLLAEKKFGGLIIVFVSKVKVSRGTVPLFADGICPTVPTHQNRAVLEF